MNDPDKKYTRAEIEELAKQDPSTLTLKERRLVNILPTMNKKGETGDKHYGGRKPGTRNWDTMFRKLMNDDRFLDKMGLNIPPEWHDTVEKYPASVIAAGMITMAARDVVDSVNSGKKIDKATLDLLDRIAKFGYGDKVVHDIEKPSFFDRTEFHFNVIPDRKES